MVINVHVVDSGQGSTSKCTDGIWRPRRVSAQTASLSENEQRTEEFFRTVRGLLNKLTPINFCIITEKLKLLITDDMLKIDGVVSMVLEKAVKEPKFSRWYLEMLCTLSRMLECDHLPESSYYRCDSLFSQKLLVLFEILRTIRIDSQIQAEIDACSDPAKRLLLQEQQYETIMKIKASFRGAGLVIGEAYVLQIINTKTILYCMETLLTTNDENSLECLNTMLIASGKTLEYHLEPTDTEKFFEAINTLSETRTLSTRIRFMLKNLLECKMNSWIPRYALKDLQIIDELFSSISKRMPNVRSATSTSELLFSIDFEEAQHINDIFNKFTQCCRNLTDVIYCFQKIIPDKKCRIIELFITCVAKGDIYSEECGKLFSVLIYTNMIVVQTIVDGLMAVIKKFFRNIIFSDQQMWMHVKEIFIPLIVENIVRPVDFNEIKKLVTSIPERKSTKKAKNSKTTELSWRRAVPVKEMKTKSKMETQFDEKDEDKEP